MVKELSIDMNSISMSATAGNWKKYTKTLIQNTGKSDLRIDKAMIQATGYHNGTNPCVLGCVLSLSDMSGACFDAGVTDVNDAAVNTLLTNWKEYVWATDWRFVGTGQDEIYVPVFSLEPDTKRLLSPGQSLFVTVLARTGTSEASKTMYHMLDLAIWYSPAAV